jgi:hypothetical protein
MISWLYTAMAGLAAGSVHAVSGPDHLAAVTPLTVSSGRPGWRTGALWGVGHAVGVALWSGLALGARELLPPGLLAGWSERLVGVTLVVLGIWGLRRALAPWLHSHRHMHGGRSHAHVHWHRPVSPSGSHAHTHASLWIGMLHGLAGGSHLLGIVPALALPTASSALGYLLGFAAGTVLAMSCFAALIGTVAPRLASRPAAGRAFLAACSLVALGVGVGWLAV